MAGRDIKFDPKAIRPPDRRLPPPAFAETNALLCSVRDFLTKKGFDPEQVHFIGIEARFQTSGDTSLVLLVGSGISVRDDKGKLIARFDINGRDTNGFTFSAPLVVGKLK